MAVDAHRENGARDRADLVDRIGKSDTARLAALAGRHLRLDDARTDRDESRGRGLFGLAVNARRHGDAGRCQDACLGHMLEKIHRVCSL